MTAVTEQQGRPLVTYLAAAGYRHHPDTSSCNAWETGDSWSIRVIIYPLRTIVRAYDAQMQPAWTAKFTKATPDSRIVAFLNAEEKGLGHG